jgi:hypothetical protein
MPLTEKFDIVRATPTDYRYWTVGTRQTIESAVTYADEVAAHSPVGTRVMVYQGATCAYRTRREVAA